MSLTQTHHLFGGISESGFNHFAAAFFSARPHLLAYGTPYYASNQNVVTLLDTSSLPLFLSGLQCLVQFTIPTVDIAPADSGAELFPPGADQFTLFTRVALRLLCGPATNPTGAPGKGDAHEIGATFDVAVLCAPQVVDSTPGSGSIGISTLQVKITSVAPPGLEQMIECFVAAVLRWALAQVIVPFYVFTVDGVSLTLQQGPLAAQDQIEVWGDIT